MDINVGSKPKNQLPNANSINTEVQEEVAIISRKVKLMENSIAALRASLQSLEQNYVKHAKESTRDIKSLEEENDELKETMRQVKDTMKKVLEDFENAAQKSEVDVIKQYLDLWNPVKFTTPEQVKRIVVDILEEQLDRKIEENNKNQHIYNSKSAEED